MGKINEEEIKEFVKRVFPKVINGWPKTPCPDESIIAAFIDGKLRGRGLQSFYSHLLTCKRCENNIRFLRSLDKMEESDYVTPDWLDDKIRKLFPQEPKELEIVLRTFATGFEVKTYNGESCFTFPELERVMVGKTKPSPQEDRQKIIDRIETFSPRLSGGAKKVNEIMSELNLIDDEIVRIKNLNQIQGQKGKALLEKREGVSKQLLHIKKSFPVGFLFQDQFGNNEMDLLIKKSKGDATGIVNFQMGICDLVRRPPEAMEAYFMQGGKPVERFIAKEGFTISKKIRTKTFGIKFKQYGIYMGQVVVDFRK